MIANRGSMPLFAVRQPGPARVAEKRPGIPAARA